MFRTTTDQTHTVASDTRLATTARACGAYRRRGAQQRRGIMLLIVISVLMLFLLIGITFVTITSNASRSTRAAVDAMTDRVPLAPTDALDSALTQLLVGPDVATNPTSVLRNHGLLEDIYGHNYFEGVIPATIAATPPSTIPADTLYANVPGVLSFNLENSGALPLGLGERLNGRVFTMLDGPLAGQSARVIQFQTVPISASAEVVRIHVMGYPAAGTLASQFIGHRYVINGRPFSGTGFGYAANNSLAEQNSLTLQDINAALPAYPMALLPNHSAVFAYIQQNLNITAAEQYLNLIRQGGANEDYDAADFQSMHLGWIVPNGPDKDILSSFHRPDLINYWVNQGAPGLNTAFTAANSGGLPVDSAQLLRMSTLRPMPFDHRPVTPPTTPPATPSTTDFTGRTFAGVTPLNFFSEYDVDNDGDGQKDSVWLDIGLPVTRNEAGELIKPLAAYLVLDLDGRANLNAHGSSYAVQWNGGTPLLNTAAPDPLGVRFNLPPARLLNQLPQGSGYGPADVNLSRAFQDTSIAGIHSLLTSPIGRYGSDRAPGVVNFDDPVSAWRQFLLPQAPPLNPHTAAWGYFEFMNRPFPHVARISGFGTPPNYTGSNIVALDHRGAPLYFQTRGTTYPPVLTEPAQFLPIRNNNDRIDDPYELNLSQTGSRPSSTVSYENPFTVFELERLLRPFDLDSELLPSRIWEQLGNADKQRSHAFTTESWDLPVPSNLAPQNSRDLGSLNNGLIFSVGELLRARLMEGGVTNPVILENHVRFLLPQELLTGQKLNLNRYFGDGVDNNGNGVVDEPYDIDVVDPLYDLTNGEPIDIHTTGNPLVYVTDAGIDRDWHALYARQNLARHLYTLMMLMTQDGFGIEYDGTSNAVQTAEYIAQWAVNVVDFMDRDSIMTRFDYDPEPFNGVWTPTRHVWGTERPELLITETLATHDRRTEDIPSVGGMADPHLDQRLTPQGSLFIELYNPWSFHDAPSYDLQKDYSPGEHGVDLTKLSGGGTGSPVWRIIVANRDSIDNDPDSPTTPFLVTDIERSIYFTNPSALPVTADGGGNKRFWSNWNPNDLSPILPGRHALVGPGRSNETSGEQVTIFGWPTGVTLPTGDPNHNTTRHVGLAPNANPHQQQVEVGSNAPDFEYDFETVGSTISDVKPAAAFVINQPQRLSLTEPLGGYPVGTSTTLTDGLRNYDPVRDEPLDFDRGSDFISPDFLMTTGTHTRFRRIHLQRLANPLLPFHPDNNPYRTIDSAPVDLTVFNGITPTDNSAGGGGAPKFATWQRGITTANQADAVDPVEASQLWSQNPRSNPAVTTAADTSHIFAYHLRHTLGFTNNPNRYSRADVNNGIVPTEYLSDSRDPHPWFTWNNRPFANAYELMLVPAGRSSLLLQNPASSTAPEAGKFGLVTGSTQNAYLPGANNVAPFSHLLNFFQSAAVDSAAVRPDFHRIFDFVQVPTRFSGNATYLDPTIFGTGGVADHLGLRPPYNWFSSYREPGKININTIADPKVWEALLNQPGTTTTPTWQQLVQSRRGDAVTNPLDSPGNNMPTVIGKPFRGANSADLVPVPDMSHTQGIVDATLLRRGPSGSEDPLLAATSASTLHNVDTNPYFRYQTLARIGNSVTTRSNVYAIWITMGYFEVERVPVSAVYPDGYRLIRESGVETGDARRHRAFYIYDRTIPVAAMPGQKLNSHDGLLLRKILD